MPAVDLLGSEGADDQGRRRSEAAHDVAQRLDRHVRAVQILEEKHQRLAGREPDERAREKLEDLSAVFRLARFHTRRGRLIASGSRAERVYLAEGWKQGDQLGAQIRKVHLGGAGGCRVALPEVFLDRLAKPEIRKRSVLFDAAPVEGADLARMRELLQVV